MSKHACPICHSVGTHKMDCQNASYVRHAIAEVEAANQLQATTILRYRRKVEELESGGVSDLMIRHTALETGIREIVDLYNAGAIVSGREVASALEALIKGDESASASKLQRTITELQEKLEATEGVKDIYDEDAREQLLKCEDLEERVGDLEAALRDIYTRNIGAEGYQRHCFILKDVAVKALHGMKL